MSAGFANVTSITSCCRQHVKRVKGYSTMNIRLTLRDYRHNNTPKDRKILLTTSASFFKALAVLNNFCCSKNEYICPYTRLGTAAILTPQARGQMFVWWTPLKMRTLALNYGINRQGNRVWKENLSPFPFNDSMRCCWTPRFRIIIAPFRLVLRRLEMGRMKNTGKDKEQTVVHLKP